MKSYRKGILVLAMMAAMALGVVCPAPAKDKPADNMQILIKKLQADKKMLVAANLELTESEAKAFWPVYQKYQDELFLLRARTGRLLKDYAEALKNMTDEKARELLDESMTIDSLGQKLREMFLPEFRKVLPEKKVARYYQIERKIQAALYYELAREIPLVQ